MVKMIFYIMATLQSYVATFFIWLSFFSYSQEDITFMLWFTLSLFCAISAAILFGWAVEGE